MSNILDSWRAIWRRGWSLVPLEPHGKKARVPWSQYQQRLATRDEVNDWLHEWPDANPGIVTGRLSNIVVLDVDGDEGDSALWVLGELPPTPTVKTARGVHYFFAYPALDDGQRVITKAGIAQNVDVRGDGGYVVGPGSVHPSGQVYEWLVSPDECALAPLPDWLAALVIVDTPDPLASIAAPDDSPPRGDGEKARRYVLTALSSEVERVSSAPDGTKHDTLLSAAAKMGGFIPVLTEQEIESALFGAVADRAKDKRAALKTIRDGIDWGLRNPRPLPEAPTAPPPRLEPPLEAYAQEEPSPDRPTAPSYPWKFTWLPDLVAPPIRTDWVWEGYIAPREMTLLSGTWKSGKTQLIAHLIKALAPPDEDEAMRMPPNFIGVSVTPCKVMVITEEGVGRWVARRDALRIGDHAGIVTVVPEMKRNLAMWEMFNRWVMERVMEFEVGLVVYDTLPNLWHLEDEMDNPAIVKALDAIQVVVDTGAGILLMGHMGKDVRGEFKAARGGGALLGRVDTIMEFHRLHPDDDTDTHRVIKCVGRDISGATIPRMTIDYSWTDGYTVSG